MKSEKHSPQRHPLAAALLVAVPAILLLMNGCAVKRRVLPPATAPLPRYPEQQKPITPSPGKLGPAASLYQQAKQSIRQGRYRNAELTLERALRIEPENAFYWHTMADLKYRQNSYGQAQQFALKSNSLANGDYRLMQLNQALIAKCHAESGGH